MAMINADVVATQMERVRSKVPTLFERDDKWWSRISKATTAEKVSSRDMRAPLQLRPGGKFGHYDPDGGSLGRGSAQQYDKAIIPLAFLKEGYEFTRLAEWSGNDKSKAVIDAVTKLFSDALTEFRTNIDRLCMTDGTGTLGTIASLSSSGGTTTVVMSATDGYGARLLRPQGTYQVFDTTLMTKRDDIVLTYYDSPTKTIKYLDISGDIVTDKIVVSGALGTPPVSIYGVPYHQNSATSGTWLGLNRANVPEIRGNSVTANSALALPFARLAMNKMGDRLGIDESMQVEAWMHPCQKQAYEELGQLVTVIQSTGDNSGKKLDPYFGGQMQMAGAPVMDNFSWDKTRIDFIVPSTWGRCELTPCDFYKSRDGRSIFEARGSDGGVATSEMFYYTYNFNLFNGNPVAGSYISGLTIPTGY